MTPVVRLFRRVGSAVLLLATLAAGDALVASTPDTDRLSRPFVTTGAVGQPVAAGPFVVTVLGVRGGTQVAQRSAYPGLPPDVYATGGLFLLVRIRMTAAAKEPIRIEYAAVSDQSGRTFLASERMQQFGRGYYVIQPGLTVEGEILFELPPDAVGELSLRVSSSRIASTFYQRVAEVPLSVTPQQRAAWLKEWRVQEIDYPKVVA